MQIKPPVMFYKNIFHTSTLYRYIRLTYVIASVILLVVVFIAPLPVIASSYPSIGRIPEASSSGYMYNSFEEFKHSMNYGNKPAEEANQNFDLSSDMIGISGPFSFNVTYSDNYGLMLNAHFASMMSTKTAYAIEGQLGFKMNRINLTIGHAFSPRNRVKLTVERLGQKQLFNFDSGSIEQCVSQYAGGGEFQHLLGIGFLNNISLGGYYAQALSQTLDPILYFDKNNTPWINYRHIAGARSRGFNASLGIRPWETATITLTGYYDWIDYDNLYQHVSAENSSNVGFGITLSQYISSSLQATASYINRAVYQSIALGLSFCHNIFHDTRGLAISVSGTQSSSDNVPRDNSVTLGLNYYFGPMNDTYHIAGFQVLSLKTWTSNPAVRMDQVLVAADQTTKQAEVSSLTSDVFIYNMIDTTGTIAEKISWHDITSNVPNAEIQYYITLTNTTALQQHLLQSASSLPDNQLVNGTTFTIDDLKSNAKYAVKLRAVEKHSGAYHIYSGSFTTGEDTINWPSGGLHLRVIAMSHEDGGLLKARIQFDLAKSTISSPISYHVTVTSQKDSNFKFSGTYDDKAVESGINVPGLHPNISDYKVTVKPTDNYGATGEEKTDTFETSKGEINWYNTNQNVDVSSTATTASVSFSQAIPSVKSALITYQIKGSNQNYSFSRTITSDKCTKTTCNIKITGLLPSETYSIQVTAIDDWDYPTASSPNQTFKTAQGDMTWVNADKVLPDDNIHSTSHTITLQWTPAIPSVPNKSITYTIYKSKDTSAGQITSDKCTSNSCEYEIKDLSVDTAYQVHVTASDGGIDADKTTMPQTVSTQKGTMSWHATSVTFDPDKSQLSWEKATSNNSNEIKYHIEITSDSDNHNVIINNTLSDNNGEDSTYTIQNKLPKNKTYYAVITASDPVDTPISKGHDDDNFSFSIPGGKLTWDHINPVYDQDTYKTLSWSKAKPSVSYADVTYTLTITANEGEQALPKKKNITVNNESPANPSYTFDNGERFLPGVQYTIDIIATDIYDSNPGTPDPAIWIPDNNYLTWTWNTAASVSYKVVNFSKEYTIKIHPDVTISPVIKQSLDYHYAIYTSANNNTVVNPKVDTLIEQGTYTDTTITKKYDVTKNAANTYYKVRITASVHGFANTKNKYLIQTYDASEKGHIN